MTITTDDECMKCKYGILEEKSKAQVYISCLCKENKQYFYGQCIQCENFIKKEDE